MNMVRKSSPRAQRREETTTRLAESALGIVTREGLEALTMQRLASELGYAVGALYRYFPSKDALLLAVQRRVLEVLAADLADARAKMDAHLARSRTVTPRVAALSQLLAASRVYATWREKRPAHFGLLARFLGDPAPLVSIEAAMPAVPALLELFGAVPALFDAAHEAGALEHGDARRRTLVLWGGLSGALSLGKLNRYGVEALRSSELARELERALFVGWGADHDELSEAHRRAVNVVS